MGKKRGQELDDVDQMTPNQDTERDERKPLYFNPAPFNIGQDPVLRDCPHPQLRYVFPHQLKIIIKIILLCV